MAKDVAVRERREQMSARRRVARARILDAMASVVYERGFQGASVTAVCARAKVSRQTFYAAFEGRDDCFLAVLDQGYLRAESLISRAFEDAGTRCEGLDATLAGLRGALVALLSFFDAQHRTAWVWLVESQAAGSWALERRERHVAALTQLIVGFSRAPGGVELNPLTAASVMAAVLGTVQSHVTTRRQEPLLTLLGPLMGIVTAPYFEPRAMVVEVERGAALAQKILAARESQPPSQADCDETVAPGLLCDLRAHRARDCLRHLAEHPGASNREVATAVGIARDSHISTLLARLRRLGLLIKRPGPPGGPNAWSLSKYGLQVAQALESQSRDETRAHSLARRLPRRQR